MDFARREFTLHSVQSDGTTLKAHAEAIARATGEIPEEYQSLPLPPQAEHIWIWFNELSRTRSSNGFGQNPISYAEIKCWSELTGVTPQSDDIQAIMALDNAYLGIQGEEMKKRSQKK